MAAEPEPGRIGIRWDMDTPRWETRNQQNGFDPVPINPVSNTPGIVTFSGRDGLSKYAHRFDKNNFGPRFGFAWRPAGEKTVLRGGYGVMFGPIYDASMGRVMNLGFGDVRSFASPDGGLTPAFLLRSGVPTPQPAPLGPGLGAVPVGRAVEASPGFIANDHANTYAHHFNFTIQRQVFGTYLAEAGYLANLAHKVGGPAISINEIRPELRGAYRISGCGLSRSTARLPGWRPTGATRPTTRSTSSWRSDSPAA